MSVQWKSRRLASRALKVLERHKATSTAVAAFEAPLGTAARAFVARHTEAGAYKAQWRVEMEEGRGSMAALKKTIDAWKPHVARERPGVDITEIADKPNVPEDLVEDAHALADQLRAVGAPWAIGAADELTAKADAVEKETDEAAAADAHYSQLLAQVREAHAVFDAELSRFRATLRTLLGSSHPDFQKLRAQRASSRDVDDDPSGPAPSPPVTPAPAPPST